MPSPGARASPCNARVNHGSSSPAGPSEGSLLIDPAVLGYGGGYYDYEDYDYDADGYDSDNGSYYSDDYWSDTDSLSSSEATDEEEYLGEGEPYQGTFVATVVPYGQALANANLDVMEGVNFSASESTAFEIVIVDDDEGFNDHLETLDLAVFVSEESLMEEPVHLDTTEYWASYGSGDLESDDDESCISRSDFANILSEQNFVSVDQEDEDMDLFDAYTSENETPMATSYGTQEDGIEYADVPIFVDTPITGNQSNQTNQRSGDNVLKRKLEIESGDEGELARQKSFSSVES
ncbi:unnamed protein product [Clonostachys chloroleuca]|uniref:Uncharacterized protein n=1 Tax=Clonostachys chloroleuca TaxID=1926264 RepID=A0AA35MCA5_9HYPO|nr:unnamed protein product [Clonostachys chloroleuca]